MLLGGSLGKSDYSSVRKLACLNGNIVNNEGDIILVYSPLDSILCAYGLDVSIAYKAYGNLILGEAVGKSNGLAVCGSGDSRLYSRLEISLSIEACGNVVVGDSSNRTGVESLDAYCSLNAGSILDYEGLSVTNVEAREHIGNLQPILTLNVIRTVSGNHINGKRSVLGKTCSCKNLTLKTVKLGGGFGRSTVDIYVSACIYDKAVCRSVGSVTRNGNHLIIPSLEAVVCGNLKARRLTRLGTILYSLGGDDGAVPVIEGDNEGLNSIADALMRSVKAVSYGLNNHGAEITDLFVGVNINLVIAVALRAVASDRC